MKREIWKLIYDGVYAVSNLGRVRRSSSRLSRMRPRVLSPGIVRGYKQVVLCIGGVKYQRKVHQLVAEAFIGPCPLGCEVNHEDTDKLNNIFSNLEYVTQKQNAEHASKNGLLAFGEKNWCSKLSEKAVRSIRQRYKHGNGGKLSREYKVTPEAIYAVVKRRVWKHVK